MSSEPSIARVLVDTGPLVAILRSNDVYHRACTETLRRIRPPLLTCWPVLTETAWLLKGLPRALDRLYAGERSGVFRVLSLEDDSLHAISQLRRQYRSLRPQLADLTLVHLADRERIDAIFTLDRRDFTAFKRKSRKTFQLLPESF